MVLVQPTRPQLNWPNHPTSASTLKRMKMRRKGPRKVRVRSSPRRTSLKMRSRAVPRPANGNPMLKLLRTMVLNHHLRRLRTHRRLSVLVWIYLLRPRGLARRWKRPRGTNLLKHQWIPPLLKNRLNLLHQHQPSRRRSRVARKRRAQAPLRLEMSLTT